MLNNTYTVVDAHCHIYTHRIASRAVAGTDNFYGLHSAFDGTVETMMAEGVKAGVDHFVVQSVATAPKQVNSINHFIAETVAQSGGKLTGLGTLHPDSTDLAGDVAHILELGLHGVKLHPDIQQFKIDDYRCLKIYELCERKHLPILLHTGDSRYDYSNPNRLLPVMEIYTGLTVVGAHLGGWSVWDEAAEKLAGLPNFYVDSSSSFAFMEKDHAKALITAFGTDRVLFGTDHPMWPATPELDYLLSLGFSEKENRRMLCDNACKIFGITL
ncbi:MAG: amidohydrolase family protein [Clostridia bacterium]|nr:amidohydrolase family protein [Clostridia bacterium]